MRITCSRHPKRYQRKISSSTKRINAAEEAAIYEDIQEISQEFTSENTSINSTKLPAIFKMVSFEPGTINLDFGGGRFDNVADYLTQYDVINLVYDPYNRSKEHNQEVIKTIRNAGGADTATCSNVLNVIKEPEVRKNVLNNIKKLVKPGGEVYITVYEGKGNSEEGPTKSGYQLNRKTADYMSEIQEVFPNANRKGKLIQAVNASTNVKNSTNTKKKFTVHASSKVNASNEYSAEKFEGYTIKFDSKTPCFNVYDEHNELEETGFKNKQEAKDWIKEHNKIYQRVGGAAMLPGIGDYDPPEYDEPDEVSPFSELLEIPFDCNIIMDSDGNWDYEDESCKWADGPGRFGDWYSEEHDIYITDNSGIVEAVDDLLVSKLPTESGRFHISGVANLYFNISDLYVYKDYQGKDEDGDPIFDETYDKDSASASFDYGNSYIDNFNIESLQ